MRGKCRAEIKTISHYLVLLNSCILSSFGYHNVVSRPFNFASFNLQTETALPALSKQALN